jgi:RNA-directed DNA polymerase
MTNKELTEIAEKYNPVIGGWLNYYGKYGRAELSKVLDSVNRHLCHWIRRKYKRYKHKPYQARCLLKKISLGNRDLFAHWKVGILPSAG